MEARDPHEHWPILGVLTLIHGAILFVAFGILALVQALSWLHTLPEIMNMTCSLGGGLFAFLQIVAGSLLLQKKKSARPLIDGSALGSAILALLALGHGLAFSVNLVDVLCLVATSWPLGAKFAMGSDVSS